MKENIRVQIYVDEQYLDRYMAIGALIIPEDREGQIIEKLNNLRCLKNKDWIWDFENCPYKLECKKEWHTLNGSHLHYREFTKSSSNAKKEIAKRWLNFLIQHNKEDWGIIYFNMLYINLNNLSFGSFGEDDVYKKIYNRFLRTSLGGALKWMFPEYKKVIVVRLYHDEGNMEHHIYFKYFNLKKLEDTYKDKISVENRKVIFVSGDHREYLDVSNAPNIEMVNKSQFIQFIDLILGTTSQNIFYLSKDPFKMELASIIRPLVERLLRNPDNQNSRFNYYRKQQIKFFPKFKINERYSTNASLDGENVEIDKDLFYTPTKLEMPNYDPQIPDLWSFDTKKDKSEHIIGGARDA